jgi:hypothetical protein
MVLRVVWTRNSPARMLAHFYRSHFSEPFGAATVIENMEETPMAYDPNLATLSPVETLKELRPAESLKAFLAHLFFQNDGRRPPGQRLEMGLRSDSYYAFLMVQRNDRWFEQMQVSTTVEPPLKALRNFSIEITSRSSP